MSDAVLLPFRPRWSQRILAGDKQLEFRTRRIPINTSVFMYETKPTQAIVGGFIVAAVDGPSSKILPGWLKAGAIRRIELDGYARGRPLFAHWVEWVVEFATPVEWWRTPPQNLVALTLEDQERIVAAGQPANYLDK